MKMRSKTWKVLAVGAALAAMQMHAVAQDKTKDRGWMPDSVSAEYGSGPQVRMVRAAVQWDWNKQWLSTGGWSLGGYWDLNVMQWHGDKHKNVRGSDQGITSIGITPVFAGSATTRKASMLKAALVPTCSPKPITTRATKMARCSSLAITSASAMFSGAAWISA